MPKIIDVTSPVFIFIRINIVSKFLRKAINNFRIIKTKLVFIFVFKTTFLNPHPSQVLYTTIQINHKRMQIYVYIGQLFIIQIHI